MSSIQLWAILTALAGLVTLAVGLTMENLPKVKAAKDKGCWTNEPVFRFEFARKQEDLDAIFRRPADECRPKVVAAMNAVNTLDVLLFIPAYTAFLVFAPLFLAGGELRLLTLAAIATALLACAADYLETIKLLSYTPGLNPTLKELATSSTAAWTKFGALAVNALCLAALCFTGNPPRPILGVLLCLPAIGVTLMAIDLKWIPLQKHSFTVSWGPLFVIAALSAIA